MKYAEKDESLSKASHKDLKCIWMTAGVISYKLCKYDLQCERCPLDRELRNIPCERCPLDRESKNLSPPASFQTFPSEGEKKKPFAGSDFSSHQIKKEFLYHPGHTWVKVESPEEVRVGIDPFLVNLLQKVKVIVLPLTKKRIVQGENLCSMIQEEGVLHLISPISGLVISINENLEEHPELVSSDPLGEGFLLTLKPKDFQKDQTCLLSGEDAFFWGRKEWERFKETVMSELGREQGGLGITMQDGGIKLGMLKNLMDPSRYIQLLNRFLRDGERSFSHP